MYLLSQETQSSILRLCLVARQLAEMGNLIRDWFDLRYSNQQCLKHSTVINTINLHWMQHYLDDNDGHICTLLSLQHVEVRIMVSNIPLRLSLVEKAKHCQARPFVQRSAFS